MHLLQIVLALVLAQTMPLTAPRIDAAASCTALLAEPRARDLRTVDGALGACYETSLIAALQGIPTPIIASMGYFETRWRPKLVGAAGERGALQACPKYWPKANTDPARAAVEALLATKSYAVSFYGRVQGRGWKPALAIYSGGMTPNWLYADKVYGLARRVAARRGLVL